MLEREAAAEEPRNAAALAGNFVIGRIGWIFKTESVIVPAFVDAVAGPGWIRGLLPILNRLAQSMPPFLFARRVKNAAFRELKTLEDFDWGFNPRIKRDQMYDLATGKFLKQRRDVLFCAPPGTGKPQPAQYSSGYPGMHG